MSTHSLRFLLAAALTLVAAGCSAPIGADRVPTRRAYEQVEADALASGRPGADTLAILHRYDLDRLAGRHPDEAVRQLHGKAVATGERALLFALAELSYAAGEDVRRSLKSWEPRDARDFYLGSAVYAWLFLFGSGSDLPPGPFDRRFRKACDFYNYGLGLALTDRRGTNPAITLETTRRRLPVGSLALALDTTHFSAPLTDFDRIVLADRFRVRGLSVRNRDAGVGAPLICDPRPDSATGTRRSTPATVFLRGPASLAELADGTARGSLELHETREAASVDIAGATVPLETDLTVHRAYTLNQARIWKLGKLDFLAPAEHVTNQLNLHQPYSPDRIPVVFVHGTFSSPVTWAEMANTLTADPVLRRRYQLWSFLYGSGNPMLYSAADLRAALMNQVRQLDPLGTNALLRRMVVIGHSQGGLLAKTTALDSGDRLWRLLATNRLEDLPIPESQREELRDLLFYEPLPCVQRVVFIATPHRGSYLSGSAARRLARRLVSLPGNIVSRGSQVLDFARGSEVGRFLNDRMPTSLDGMSPKNPALLALAEIPVAPGITAHSIIPVRGDRDPNDGGRDGVVAYASAHHEGVKSEFIVRSGHSCLNEPATIEEVRRILKEHLEP